MTDQDGSFEGRLHAAQMKRTKDPSQPVPQLATPPGALNIGARVGVELVAALAVAVAIGWGLDRWLGTTPWLTSVFVLLGGAAGVANVWRLMMPQVRGKDERG